MCLMAKKVYLLIFFLIFSILFFGCGSDPEEEGGNSAPLEDVKSGWEKYKAGEYGSAIISFEEAISLDGSHLSDAYNGLGWVYLGFSGSIGVNQKNVATSLGKFQEAVVHNDKNSDAWVGQALLLLVRRGTQDDLTDALEAIDKAMQGDSEYLYRHDYDSESDLHALKAQCYYYLGEPDKAREELERALAVEKNSRSALAMKNLLY